MGKFEKVTQASFKGLRGIKAKEGIAKGEDVVVISRRFALWVTSATSCPFPDWIDKRFFSSAQWFVKLGLMLLHEKRLGSASKLKDYVSNLPEAIDTPHFWTPAERGALHCRSLLAAVEQQSQTWAGQYEALISSSPSCGVAKADFDWALACVVSRTFGGPAVGSTLSDRLNILTFIAGVTALCLTLGLFPEEKTIAAALSAVAFNFMYELILSRNYKQYALCPVIDLINHDSAIDSEVTYDYFKDSYAVLAGRTFKAGEQVFISYGMQTSDTLLQYYGFVEDSNPHDAYTFLDFLALLQQVLPSTSGRLEELQRGKDAALTDALRRLRLTNKAQVGDDAKCALRYVLGIADSVEAGRDKVSNARDAVLWAAVLAVCEAEYLSYPTTLEQEQKLLQNAGRAISERRRMICLYNIAKKKFMVNVMEQLRVRVAKMSS